MLKSIENSALKSFKGEVYYQAYSPALIINKNDQAIQDLFAHSQSKEARLRKLEELKRARHQILNEKARPVRKLKSKGKGMGIHINDKYMDSQFTNSISELDPQLREARLQEEALMREMEDCKNRFVKTLSQESRLQEVSVISEREWRKLVGMHNTIAEFDPLQSVSPARIRKSLAVGIPDSLRGEIWCMLCCVQREKQSHSADIY
mmetsp:Transcript_6705/g.11259  ORF Transcript_6705/g.11259 Transcript_6705/m.11259 type:complete len:206 (+) Transcript_6705:615-1232(+)